MKKVNLLTALTISLVIFTCCEKEKPIPIASFTMSKNAANVDEIISFTNTSQHATSYSWDLGDGNTSTDENPTYSYSTAGTFTVTLTASGEGGENSTSESITIVYPSPIASFTMDKSTAEKGETIVFTNTSQNATSYSWDFGDGNTSTDENPTHSYSSVGTFIIELAVTGEGGSNSTTKSIEITSPPFNIVPGESIGDFILGDNIKTHKDKISDTWVQHAMILMNNGMYLHLLKYAETGIGFFIETNSATVNDNDIPHAIYAFLPFEGNTEKGITFGSLLTDVAEAYGEPESISSTGSYSYISTLGISFWADDTKTMVEEIYIAAPDPSKKGAKLYRLILENELRNDI